MPILIQARNDVLNISGALDGTLISVYDLGGIQLTTSTAVNGITKVPVNTTAPILIVKIGEKTAKVKMK